MSREQIKEQYEERERRGGGKNTRCCRCERKRKKERKKKQKRTSHRHAGLPRRRRGRRGGHRHALRHRRDQLRRPLQRQLLRAVAGEHVPDLVRDDEREGRLVVGEAADEAAVDDDLAAGQGARVDLVVVDDDDLPGEVLEVVCEPALPVPAQRGPDDGGPQPGAPLRLGRRVRQPALGRQKLGKRRLSQGSLDAFGHHHGVLPSGKRDLLPRVFSDDAEEEDGASCGEEREAGVHVFSFVEKKKRERLVEVDKDD